MSDAPEKIWVDFYKHFSGTLIGRAFATDTGDITDVEYRRVDLCSTRAQLGVANAKLALHESENVTLGLLIDELQARVDAAAEQMRETLQNIRELNMTAEDDEGFRWASSDLIEQEIVFGLHALPLHEGPSHDAG